MRLNDEPGKDKCPWPEIDVSDCHANNGGICMNGLICEETDKRPEKKKWPIS